MNILAAPIQEYTDAAFRNAHATTIGGIDEYYTPFIRLERGALSRRSAMDIAPASNTPANIVPQILAKNAEETRALLAVLAANGYGRADINFGCPFPKVLKGGYGAAVLENHDAFRSVLEEACSHASLKISVKLRLGMTDAQAAMKLLPILNDAELDKVVLHPRTALLQYSGTADKEAFAVFRSSCRHAVFYNGDIRSADDTDGIENIMIGRGLLANPLLPLEMRGEASRSGSLDEFHSAYVEECRRLFQQPLQKLKLLWDFFLPQTDKRLRKAIVKAATMEEYLHCSQCAIKSI